MLAEKGVVGDALRGVTEADSNLLFIPTERIYEECDGVQLLTFDDVNSLARKNGFPVGLDAS